MFKNLQHKLFLFSYIILELCIVATRTLISRGQVVSLFLRTRSIHRNPILLIPLTDFNHIFWCFLLLPIPIRLLVPIFFLYYYYNYNIVLLKTVWKHTLCIITLGGMGCLSLYIHLIFSILRIKYVSSEISEKRESLYRTCHAPSIITFYMLPGVTHFMWSWSQLVSENGFFFSFFYNINNISH